MNHVWVIFGQEWDDWAADFDLHFMGVLGNTNADTIRKVISTYPGLPAPDAETLDHVVASLLTNTECELDVTCPVSGKEKWVIYNIRKKEVYR
ncbi:hypothetical protein QE320_gp047 [Pseudomonas phage EM]|uniref:Uncharacterized protein n=1 Tax=Pseudomonas phage EM TaxID=2936914 RepID=A0AAE9HIY1_9CAUD|nr:hypothetical protein QE320_gp047 [Pseudomonas phage EM]UPW35849.1 hypothetical protein EM_047 [Pseudomonas phage EM]